MLVAISLDPIVDVKTFDLSFFFCLPTMIATKTLALRDIVEAIPPGEFGTDILFRNVASVGLFLRKKACAHQNVCTRARVRYVPDCSAHANQSFRMIL